MYQRFSFCNSESTSIRKLTETGEMSKLEIDPASVHEYLKFGYVHAPRTIFRNVKRLDVVEPPVRADARMDIGPAEARRLAQAKLRCVLGQKLLGRTSPAGLFLSSGLDSCAIACAVSQPLFTYTIGFTFRAWNEVEIAQQVSSAAGHEHRNLMLSNQDLFDSFDAWIRSLNQPYAHVNALPTWIAMNHIAGETDLVLDGSGADDVMGDVGRIQNAKSRPMHRAVAERLLQMAERIPGLIPSTIAASVYNIVPDSFARLVIRGTTPIRDRMVFYDFWKGCLFPYLIGEEIKLHPDVDEMIRNLDGNVDYEYFLYHRTWAYEAAMGRVRIASEATGLPYFMPLAEPEYSDLLLQFPARALFDNGQVKHMLLDLIQAKLPSYRYSKRAIATPWSLVFKESLWRHDLENLPDQLGAIAPDRVHRIVRQYLQGNVDHSARILNLLVLARWLNCNNLKLPSGL